MTAFKTILLDVNAASHVATITLNRPDSLNAFNRIMCEEMAEAWRIVKFDESVNAVVLRAANRTPYGITRSRARRSARNGRRCGRPLYVPSTGCAPRVRSTSSTSPMW